MKKERKRGRALRALLVTLGVIVIMVGGFLTFTMGGKEKAINLTVENVALDTIPDGTYEGSYSGMRWSNTVAVTVKDHQITNIEVVKSQVFITPETQDALAQSVLDSQSVEVDAISGATADSHAYLKAVENALKSANS